MRRPHITIVKKSRLVTSFCCVTLNGFGKMSCAFKMISLYKLHVANIFMLWSICFHKIQNIYVNISILKLSNSFTIHITISIKERNEFFFLNVNLLFTMYMLFKVMLRNWKQQVHVKNMKFHLTLFWSKRYEKIITKTYKRIPKGSTLHMIMPKHHINHTDKSP